VYAAAATLPPADPGIPDPEGMDPGAWIRTVWSRYLELWPRILGLQHEAAELAAASSGSVRDSARRVVDGAAHLSRIHTATVRKVEEYSGYLGLGSGAVVGASLAVAALALVVLWSFRRYDALDATLEAVKLGALTPAEAASLLDAAGPMPDLSVLGGASAGLLLGAAGMLALLLWAARRKSNPDLVLLGMNPDPLWSDRVLRLDYVHGDNGEPYKHTFRPGVRMESLEDGSVRLYHPRRRIWRDF